MATIGKSTGTIGGTIGSPPPVVDSPIIGDDPILHTMTTPQVISTTLAGTGKGRIANALMRARLRPNAPRSELLRTAALAALRRRGVI